MSKTKHKVAVVGGVGIWGRRYVQAYVERDDCELVALADTARQRRDDSGKPVLILWESELDFPGADQQIRKLTQFTDVINVHEQYRVYSLLPDAPMTAAHH